jgi:PAS domain S-box-containing protein
VIVAEEEEEEEEEELVVLQDITERKRAEKMLQRSEENFRRSLDDSPLGIRIVNDDGETLYANRAILDIYGYASIEELETTPRKERYTPESYAEHQVRKEKRQRSEHVPSNYEISIVRKNGEIRHLEVFRKEVLWNGKTQFQVLYNDVTERKQAEEALSKSEQRYRTLFEGTLDGVFVIDAETMNVMLANKATARIFGFDSAEEVGGVNPLDFIPPDDRDRVSRIIAEDMFAKDLRQVNEFRTITRGGREIWIRAVGVRTEYQGRLAGLVSFWDITERKQAEEALRESEEKYRSLVNNISLGIFRSTPGPKGRFLEVNPAMERISGYSREELLQMDVVDLYRYPEERERVLEEVASATGMTTRELQLKRKDRSEIIVSDTKIAVRNDAGQIMYFDGIMEDITEKKKAEEEEQKIEKLQSIGTLAGGIAHDFNNILTGILGNITLAERHIEPEGKVAERLLEAKKASLRARDLTQQLLTFSKGGAPIKKTISIAELVEESATFALRGSNVKCEFSLPDDLWAVEVDEGQINQVITNMVINADEAMPKGGILHIRAKNTTIKRKGALPLAKGKYVEITIEDHGIGIPKEHLDRIFEPYFTTKQKGSGLGLATSYSIIKSHDGYITVESELGVGTTFHVYLPASEKPALEKKEAAKEVPVRGQGRILIMDDEEIIREMLSRMLSLAGYRVEVSKDGAEAVAKYAETKSLGQSFDAVILDLTVPGGMGGKEAIKKLLEIAPDVKAIVSSGYSTDPIMADFKKYGFSAVVTKPYSVGELERTLRSVLRK